MQLSHLRAFVIVAHEKNFTKSAEKLYITQPTLTFRIQELERELGYPLFFRTNRSVELTPEGIQFLDYVTHALSILDGGLKEVKRYNRSGWHLVITCIPVFANSFLPPFFSYIQSKNLPLDIALKTRHSSEAVLRIMKDGESQIGVINANLVNVPRNFRLLKLLEDTSCLVRGANFPLAGNQVLTLQEIQQLPLIAYALNHPYWRNVQVFFTSNNIQPNTIIEVDNFEIVKLLLLRGIGISILPRLTIKSELANKTLVEIKTEVPIKEKRKMCLIYPARKVLPKAVEVFLKELHDYLHETSQ